MAKGKSVHQAHLDAVAVFGKSVGKRARFCCEWCSGDQGLRLWEYRPEEEPSPENLALLCGNCRELIGARNADPRALRFVRNALWSEVPAVAEGAALLLSRCREPWAREAIQESLIDDELKARLL